MITQRIKENKVNGKRIGMFVADVGADNIVDFGYSLCKKGDKFNKEMAIKIAVARMESNTLSIPPSIWEDFEKFYRRAESYFKGAEFPDLGN